jgi:hypothetical protein
VRGRAFSFFLIAKPMHEYRAGHRPGLTSMKKSGVYNALAAPGLFSIRCLRNIGNRQ